MSYVVDFTDVSTVGLESSPVAARSPACAPTRPATSRTSTTTSSPSSRRARPRTTIDWVHRILKEERDLVDRVDAARGDHLPGREHPVAYVFYESGLSINVMYTIDDAGSGPSDSSSPTGWTSRPSSRSFKFARQKSKLAGTIRGSFFVIKGEY